MIIIAIGQMNLVGRRHRRPGRHLLCRHDAGLGPAGTAGRWSRPWRSAWLAGLANGWLVATTGISAFIITLATLSIFKGINLGITQAQPFYGVPGQREGVRQHDRARPAALAAACRRSWPPWRSGTCSTGCRIGRQILAMGGNRHAAELSGISPLQTIVCGARASRACWRRSPGVMVVARLQIGQPSIGDDWLILSFAAPVHRRCRADRRPCQRRRHGPGRGDRGDHHPGPGPVPDRPVRGAGRAGRPDPAGRSASTAGARSASSGRLGGSEHGAAGARGARHRQVVPGRGGAGPMSPSSSPRARSTRCWARTAPASPR